MLSVPTAGEAMAETPTKKTWRWTVSDDGTRIGFTKVEFGPISMVFVHGALSSGESWMPVAEGDTICLSHSHDILQ